MSGVNVVSAHSIAALQRVEARVHFTLIALNLVSSLLVSPTLFASQTRLCLSFLAFNSNTAIVFK